MVAYDYKCGKRYTTHTDTNEQAKNDKKWPVIAVKVNEYQMRQKRRIGANLSFFSTRILLEVHFYINECVYYTDLLVCPFR